MLFLRDVFDALKGCFPYYSDWLKLLFSSRYLKSGDALKTHYRVKRFSLSIDDLDLVHCFIKIFPYLGVFASSSMN